MQRCPRYVPSLSDVKIRSAVGLILLVVAGTSAITIGGGGRVVVILSFMIFAWIAAVFLTDKYIHKYPQRYFTYLIASHLKAAIIMAFLVWLCGRFSGQAAAPPEVLWTGFFGFVFADAMASAFRRHDTMDARRPLENPSPSVENSAGNRSGDTGHANTGLFPIDAQAILRQIRPELDKPVVEFIEKYLPVHEGGAGDVLIWDENAATEDPSKPARVGLLVSRIRLNDIRRLNRYFLSCAENLTMGGYFVGRYMPLENAARHLKARYAGFLHGPAFLLYFIWFRAFPKIPWLNALYFSLTNGKNRVLSKVEIWGRLSYCGMKVIAESEGEEGRYLIAQRVSLPIRNKRPSYYPIVALEKVGLDGESMYMHKIRTMFPYSEFLQQRIFEDHGLAPTGKFANDFRLTEYGSFLRKYWIDELPQIFDWLRGDVKLFGMRATSRHFLSLYPREVYNLYVQVKPGLIPPIFDESTTGLDKIAEIELAYLRSYCRQPVRTDVRYLMRTFSDIAFRGVRSR